MKKDTVVELKKPEVVAEDPLTEVLRQGARKLLMHALEAEVENFLIEVVPFSGAFHLIKLILECL